MREKFNNLKTTPLFKLGSVLFFVVTLAIVAVSIQRVQQYRSGASGIENEITTNNPARANFVSTSNSHDSQPNLSSESIPEINPATIVTGTQKVQIILLKWKAGTGANESYIIPTDKTDAANRFNLVEQFYKNESFNRYVPENGTTADPLADVSGWHQTDIPFDCNTFGNFGTIGNSIDSYINGLGLSNTYANRIVVLNNGSGCSNASYFPYASKKIRMSPANFTTSYLEYLLARNYGVLRTGYFSGCPTTSGQIDATVCGGLNYGGNTWETMGDGWFFWKNGI